MYEGDALRFSVYHCKKPENRCSSITTHQDHKSYFIRVIAYTECLYLVSKVLMYLAISAARVGEVKIGVQLWYSCLKISSQVLYLCWGWKLLLIEFDIGKGWARDKRTEMKGFRVMCKWGVVTSHFELGTRRYLCSTRSVYCSPPAVNCTPATSPLLLVIVPIHHPAGSPSLWGRRAWDMGSK